MLILLRALGKSQPPKGGWRIVSNILAGTIITLAAFWGIVSAYYAFSAE